MNRIIRKISIGTDYPRGCMHYERGQVLENKKTGNFLFKVIDILQRDPNVYEIWIENNLGEQMIWDTVRNMPVVVQYEVYL